VQQVEREEEHEAGDDDADDVADLHLPGGAAEDVADLQVLQHLAGDGGGDADDGGDAQHCGHPLHALHSHDHHGERGHDGGGEGEAGDWVVRGADHADEVAGHRGEEEAGDQHDDRREERPRQGLREVQVERDHQHENDRDPGEDGLEGEVPLGAGGGLVGGRRLLHVGDPALDAGGQVLPHAEEGEAGPDEHPPTAIGRTMKRQTWVAMPAQSVTPSVPV